MTSVRVEITNRLGLHARAAAKFVNLANQFPCDISVERDGESVEAKSILGLLLLAAAKGSHLVIHCDGEQEERALDALRRLVEDKFGEGE